MTALDLFEQLNALDEHPRIEAKTATEVGKAVLETVCAFSNEPGLDGGWLLLGVRAAENVLWPQYDVVGLPDSDKVATDLASQCASSFNLPVRVQIEPELLGDKRILKVFVPELPASQKPLFFKSRGLPGGAFRRIGSADVHCSEDDLRVFYQDRQTEAYDSTVIPDADSTGIDPAMLAEYRTIRAEVNPTAEELNWSDDDLLLALCCAKREGGILRPTVAGILLFGTAFALRRYFPMMRVDYIRVPGREWVADPERRFDTIEIRAPLLQAIRKARNAVLDDLPKAFSLPPGQLQRKDVPKIPDRVLREAIVNAVMHRSYRVHGPVQIIRYANRLEIRNPGHSLVADDRLGEPGSETRNPAIAAVLHDTNLAENKGSGIRVMRELMEQAKLTPPTFESDRVGNRFVVTLLFHHFLTPDDWTWLRQFAEVDLSDEEARALVFVREVGAINNAAYRGLNHVDVLNASGHLRRLRDRGLLVQKGKGADTYYVPTARLQEPVEPGEQPIQPLAQPIQSASQAIQLSDLPSSLAIQVSFLSGRPKLEDLRRVILDLCAWQPFPSDDLAALLKRTRVYLVNQHLGPLVKAGRLAYTIPDQPNHPHQKYRTVQPAEGLQT